MSVLSQSSLNQATEIKICIDLTLGATYIPGMAGLGRSMDALAVVPVVSALLGPVVGLAAAKTVIGHFRYISKAIALHMTLMKHFRRQRYG